MELARRTPQGVVSRPTPLRVRFVLRRLATRDRHEVDVTLDTGIRVRDTNADRSLFAEHFLQDRAIALLEPVQAQLAPALDGAALAFTQQHDAAAICTDPSTRERLLAALLEALRMPAFAIGVELLAPQSLQAHSETWQQHLAAERLAALEQQRDADRRLRLERSAGLLKLLNEMRQQTPELSTGQLLDRLGPADRDDALRATFAGDETAASTLVVVGGSRLATFPLEDRSITPAGFDLPDALGPARSVHRVRIDDHDAWLVGTRDGVLRIDPSDPARTMAYRGPSHSARTGYNAIAFDAQARQLVATHSETGFVAWSLERPEAPARTLAPADLGLAGGLRSVVALHDRRFAAAASGAVVLVEEAGSRLLWQRESPVLLLESTGRQLIAIHADGTVGRWELPTLTPIASRPIHQAIQSAATLPWLGESRVLTVDRGGSIDCGGLDDDAIVRFGGHTRGVAFVVAGPGAVVAIAADRSSASIWRPWQPSRPIAELHTFGVLRHRVADTIVF